MEQGPVTRTGSGIGGIGGMGLLPLIASVIFIVVGAAIVVNLIASLIDGRMFAFVLELFFAILWAGIAVAFWHDHRRRR